MAIEAYSPCPCGSGKKFKWCCQPIHVQINKAFEQDANGQHDVALHTMDQVIAEHPSNPEVYGRKAQLLYQMDKADDAEATLQKAFDLNPNYPFGHYLRGRFRHFEGEIPGALLLFRKAAELYDPEAHSVLAQIYSLIAECELKLNRPVAARAALQIAARQEPAAEEYRKALDEVFGPQSHYPEAGRREYTFLAPAAAERSAAADQALKTAATGKLSDARKAFEALTAEDADNGPAWYNLGVARAWLGENAAAVEALDRYVALERDEGRAEQAWALAEVLRCGYGMEDQADYVEHSAVFQVRGPDALVRLLQDLQRERRLIATQARQEEGVLSGLILEKVQALTPELQANASPHLGAYLMIVGDMLRLWNINGQTLDKVRQEVGERASGSLSEPHVHRGPALFTDILTEGMVFPLGAATDDEAKQRVQEGLSHYYEDTWIHRPLRALGGVAPVDAAGHGTLRKKVLGVVAFLQQCADATGQTYDFDRVRRQLGLLHAAAAGQGQADFGVMSAAELATQAPESLSEEQLEQAYQAALRLDARELTGRFGKALVARPPAAGRGDRYPVYSQLVQQALAEGNTDAALDYLNEGEKVDCEYNEGRRRNEYELRRGQLHAKRGEADAARDVFQRLIERVPDELRYAASAAEAMLSARQWEVALRFAEHGLAKARQQQNRDSEEHFKELVAAAQRQR